MKFIILTTFPEMYESFLNSSIIARAISKKIIDVKLVNIRDYTKDKYKRTDTPPIGGGAGLIMKAQPIIDALKANSTSITKKLVLGPKGHTFNQEKAVSLSKEQEILILCGHYEGIDDRVYPYFDEEISVGDYVLTGGETASFILIDAISRLIDGVISKDSTKEESFTNGLLEYPQYTEPYDFLGATVPDILYSGNHREIDIYHKKKSLELTREFRPDLFSKFKLNKSDIKLLKEVDSKETPQHELDAIEKGKKFTKNH
jgi:tRNA (guanine37-N1)-methyltransferase